MISCHQQELNPECKTGTLHGTGATPAAWETHVADQGGPSEMPLTQMS